MKYKFVGDIHAKWDQYVDLVDRQCQPDDWAPSIQLGDFGMGFRSVQRNSEMWGWQQLNNRDHRFIRGNHDNPEMCRSMPAYIDDGFTETLGAHKAMYLGGAWSIDWARRTEGVDWWRGEELTVDQLNQLVDKYMLYKPDIMITHDAPLSVTKQMFIDRNLALGGSEQIETRTGQALQAMFEYHQPKFWVFGHWHVTMTETINGTEFTCLGELDMKTYDL